MALLKCKECGHTVASDAKHCPGCGSAKFKGGRGWLTLVVLGVLVVWVVARCQEQGTELERTRASQEAAKTPEQRAAEAAAKAKSEREFQSAVLAGKALKASLKNPASFELVSAILTDDGVLCVVYRGTNSFNAIVTQQSAIKRDLNIGAWGRDCSGKSGRDMGHIARAL